MSGRPTTASRQREVRTMFEPSRIAERCLADAYARLVPVAGYAAARAAAAKRNGLTTSGERRQEVRRCS
jgi:hypothetical protein